MSRHATPLEESAASRPTVREIALSAAWHGGLIGDLTTNDRRRVRVIHRGTWSHGFGPDFTGAILEYDGREIITGDVEMHLDAADWRLHGHHLDPQYNGVVLHVVLRNSETIQRREDGQGVPTAVVDLPDNLLFGIDRSLPAIWDQLGSSTCAEDLAGREPHRIRMALHRLGDQRLHDRAAGYGGDLEVTSVQRVLLRGIFDAFGYSMNRAPMVTLFERLELSGLLDHWELDPAAFTPEMAMAALFGLGGFLPFSPSDAHLAGIEPTAVASIEQSWHQHMSQSNRLALAPTNWVRARTRPANHPAARLASLARLLAHCGANPLPALCDAVMQDDDPREVLRAFCQTDGASTLGMPRATSIVASVVLPVLLAWAHRSNDAELEDAVNRAWVRLPRSEWSRPALRARQQAAGEARLGSLGERAVQGLLHLDRQLCGPRRCFECPIAAEVLADRRRHMLEREVDQTMSSVLPT